MKAQTTQTKLLGMLGLLLICATLVLAIPQIIHFNNPVDGIVTSNKNVELNFNITEANLKEVKYNWNGTNTTIFDENLVLAMNFNNLSALGENDTHVYDISGNGNNGTVTGATWTSDGKYDGAFSFDGDGDYVNVSTSSITNVSNVTISSWVKLNKLPVSNLYGLVTILKNEDNPLIELKIKDGGQSGHPACVYNNGTYFDVVSTSPMTIDNWSYLTCSYTSTNNYVNLSLYINGVLDKSSISYQNYSNILPNHLYIGSQKIANARFLNGTADETRIWNKILTSEEIEKNYYSNLKKYNTDKWSLYVNQTGLTASPTGNQNYTYYACATNSTDSENCTETRIITRIPISHNITSNFSLSVGDVKSDFYGVGLFTQHLYGAGTLIDTGSGNNITYMNELFDNLGNVKVVRLWAVLNYIYNDNATSPNQTMIDVATDLVQMAKDKDFKIIWTLGYTPSWLANTTIPNFNCTGMPTNIPFPTENCTCPPTNYDTLGNLSVTFFNTIGCDADTCIAENWNEPDLNYDWGYNMGNDLTNASLRSEYMNLVINSTYYALENAFPNMTYLAPTYTTDDVRGTTMWTGFVSNFSNKTLYPNMKISTHRYLSSSSESITDNLNTRFNNIFNNCSFYGMDCSEIYLDEWGILSPYLLGMDNDTIRGMNYVDAYSWVLNNYPSNVSMLYYGFDYGTTGTYQMFNLDTKTTYASYNVTKAFATYCPAGATVYTSTSTTNDLVAVTCKKDDTQNVIVINKGSEAINLSLNLVDYAYTTIKNTETEEIYPVSSGVAQIGAIDQYEILYLTGENENLMSYLNFNENTGTTAYDISGNDNHGTITGATWNNDGVYVTLTNLVDYIINGKLFTLLNDALAYSEIIINYNNEVVTNSLGDTGTNVIDGIGSVTDWFEIFIVITAMIVLILLTVIIITAIRGSGMMGESA